jgi:hypothetical protein
MLKVKMLKDHQGAKAGDVVRFEDEAEGRALIKDEKAEEWKLKLRLLADSGHGKKGDVIEVRADLEASARDAIARGFAEEA